MKTHTPTPWNVSYDTDIYASPNIQVSVCSRTGVEGQAKINAAFIVRAVNLFDEMLNCVKDHECFCGDGDVMICNRCRIIAKAEGK